MTITKTFFSTVTSGQSILVAATSSPGTIIHSGVNSSTQMEEIWLYAYNGDTASRILTVQTAGVTSVTNDTKITIPSAQGRFLILDGRLINQNALIRAYGDVTNKITIDGYVNLYNP